MAPSLLLLIPLIAAAVLVFSPARQAKWIALAATTVVFLLSVILALGFEQWGTSEAFGLNANIPWLNQFGISVRTGADSVAMLLILLTTLLMPLCVWGSFSAVQTRVKEFYGWLLVIETAMIGVFLARDLVFFYVCFELTLVPMYFLIAIWGSHNRAKACTKFFIYTFTGSLIALAGLLYIAWRYADAHAMDWSFEIAVLTTFAREELTSSEQAWVLLALLAGFAVKVPLFPLHTWLPLAHTEAPTAGSVILAAVLLKLGTYGLYRFVLPMVPVAVVEYAPIIAVFAIIGILYAALVCWVQTDLKKLVAYSSVSHLGFCVLGLVALNPMGMQGSVLYMLNHGLSTGALFFCVGMIYERYHTRDMDKLHGLAQRMPVWSFFMVFFTLSSVGLPGLNGFVSEFLCLVGSFAATGDNTEYPGVLGPWFAAFAGVGMIVAAMYLLMMVGRVVWGRQRTAADDRKIDHHDGVQLPADLTIREIGVLAPIAVLCLVFGLYPKVLTSNIQGAIDEVLRPYPAVVREARGEPSKGSPMYESRFAVAPAGRDDAEGDPQP